MDQAKLKDQGLPGCQSERCHDTGVSSALLVSAACLFEIPVQAQQKPSADTAIIADQPVYPATVTSAIEPGTAAPTTSTAIALGIGSKLSGTAVGQTPLILI